MTDPSGEVSYILSITEDVTESKNAENALRNSEHRLRDAIESLTDGLALFDTNENLVMCNARYRAIWPGLDSVAVPGVSLEALVRRYRELAISQGPKQNLESVVQSILDRLRLSGSNHEFEILDGRWIQVSNHPIADGGIFRPTGNQAPTQSLEFRTLLA